MKMNAFMRRALGALVLSMMVAAPALASGETDDLVVTGTVLLADPATKYLLGVTETVSPCNGSLDQDVPAGAANGVDGYWIDLLGYEGHRATLTGSATDAPNAPGPDLDVWFYDEACGLIGPAADENAYHMATSSSNEFGIVPAGAAFAVVDYAVGAPAATFTFTAQGAM